MKRVLVSTLMLIFLVLVSCSSDEDVLAMGTMKVALKGLKKIGNSYQYEGWLEIENTLISIETFTVNESGYLS
ncbi:hypothetical protein V3A08_02560 [Tenacibaculum maritimum]|uniref:hypothetical protein n=1 Tax=Tenacibaculum maritimum TaxID=107401 RepID=UPI0012E6EBCA|nr:hypothetical protein [Tenacibaculum maritimum]MDB0603275.1 hypothetical protein [Tenacibaculum maritimum]MDB0610306.1 hypothetical protein [Tenacibaculum maritimum]CAA0176390.1 exported hypothetical protein [Tenacibaculum maritimum]